VPGSNPTPAASPAIEHRQGAEVVGGLAPHGTEIDLSSGRWLLNRGSVGQPRDGDPRAYYLLDVDKQGLMHEHPLPAALAERLAYGA
jgi:diadenosine tetraphosphatase ApaH/serine/threonine PP2A family protein phosphatase